jgi:hypothetical protein
LYQCMEGAPKNTIQVQENLESHNYVQAESIG